MVKMKITLSQDEMRNTTVSDYFRPVEETTEKKTKENYQKMRKLLSFRMESTPMTAMIAIPRSTNGGSDETIESQHGNNRREG